MIGSIKQVWKVFFDWKILFWVIARNFWLENFWGDGPGECARWIHFPLLWYYFIITYVLKFGGKSLLLQWIHRIGLLMFWNNVTHHCTETENFNGCSQHSIVRWYCLIYCLVFVMVTFIIVLIVCYITKLNVFLYLIMSFLYSFLLEGIVFLQQISYFYKHISPQLYLQIIFA